jgi:predicted permease
MRLLRNLRSLVSRRRREQEVDEELALHIEMEVADGVRHGLTPEAARTEALRRFGGVDRAKEEWREGRTGRWIEELLRDARYALRGLRRSPGYAAAAVATLALGIGANTAIFSAVDAILLEPLPYGAGESLVRLRHDAPAIKVEDAGFSPPEITDFRDRTSTLDEVVEWHNMSFILLGQAQPERVTTNVVSWNFFEAFGVRPVHGRTFLPRDDVPGAEAVLLLSQDYWMKSFGGDPKVVGRVFQMNDRPHTVVGILPPLPPYPGEAEVWMPVVACPFRSNPRTVQNRQARMTQVFGRIRPGVTLAQARADIASVGATLAREHPDVYVPGSGYAATVLPLREELTREARPTFLMLLAAVGLVLLLACANVANLSLARVLRREREIGLRGALGAGRWRLARQMLTESTVVALAGGILGFGLAAGAVGVLRSFAARFTPRAAEIDLDGRVLLFAVALSVLTGLFFGLAPAFSTRRDPATALREGGERSTAGGTPNRLRSALIVAQVAVSFMLLCGAGLALRSLGKLAAVDAGFSAERVLSASLALNFSRYDTPEKRGAFYDRVLERLSGSPGVTGVAIALAPPLANDFGPNDGSFEIEGRPVAEASLRPRADFLRATPEYFDVLGVPVLEGRPITDSDRPTAPRVVLVNRSFARRHFPEGDALTKRISLDRGENWWSIVGIVGDVRQYELDTEPGDQIFLAVAQSPLLGGSVLVRTTTSSGEAIRLVREAVRDLDPEQPVDTFRTLEQVRSGALASPRLTAILLLACAAVAVLITATGLGGVLAYAVSQRTHEFGIRLALGALPRSVVGMVVRQGLGLTALGLALGLGGALLFSRLLKGLLFGVTPTDPPTFLAVAALLAVVALGACLLPARRATAVPPAEALRSV